jgi:hypothetical protein
MQNRVNSFTGFQPLKEVWLGDCYPEHFYSHLTNEVQDAFGTITEWTKHDLSTIQKTLESMGVVVQRPIFSSDCNDYMKDGTLLKPPICPRDNSMALGNEFYHLRYEYLQDPWQIQIQNFIEHGVKVHINKDQGGVSCLSPPCMVRVGKDLYIDYDWHQHTWFEVCNEIMNWAKTHRVHISKTGGHSDGVFCPVGPGIIVASHWLEQYDITFPNWEVYHIPKKGNGGFGNWHLNNQQIMSNHGFAEHVNQYAKDWVGNFSETVFEVNMLVVDQHNILALKEDKDLFAWLKTRGYEVTLCDFRCRNFWDGGLHCLTTDIRREGGQENYFPNRPDFNYVDWMC